MYNISIIHIYLLSISKLVVVHTTYRDQPDNHYAWKHLPTSSYKHCSSKTSLFLFANPDFCPLQNANVHNVYKTKNLK